MRLRDIKWQNKFIMLTLFWITGLVFVVSVNYVFTEKNLVAAEKKRLQSLVHNGANQIRDLHALLVRGEISKRQFNQNVVNIIHSSASNQDYYFYLLDNQGTLLAHAVSRHLETRNILNIKDAQGNSFVKELLDNADGQDRAFIHYVWPKPNETKPTKKQGYAVRIPDTDLIIGSGFYVDDLKPLLNALTFDNLAISATIILLFSAVALGFSLFINRPIQNLHQIIKKLANGDNTSPIMREPGNDETSQMFVDLATINEQLQEGKRNKIAQEKATFLESYDPTTRLKNRVAFSQELHDAITAHALRHQHLCVLVIQFDLIGEITIELGGECRDTLLSETAKRAANLLGTEDILARLSEDSFALLLPNTANDEAISAQTHQLLKALAEPIDVKGNRLQVGGRAGISCFPADGNTDFQLIGRAERAVSGAKKHERDLLFYRELGLSTSSQNIALWQEMQKALELDQFHLVFQPIFDLERNKPVVAEVLLRWNHPEQGFISPAHFIPVAEQSGLIGSLDAWVLEAVARQCRAWIDRKMSTPRIAVNLSGISFMRPEFEANLKSIFSKYDVPLSMLELELTEGMLIDDLDQITRQLINIRKTGVSISIDDFGTGYSSLSRIKNLAIDTVKIDRSFIDEVDLSRQHRKIVEAIILMTHGLNLKVVAEGIETQAQLDELRLMGCDTVQGFFLSRPLEVTAFEQLLEQDLVIEVD